MTDKNLTIEYDISTGGATFFEDVISVMKPSIDFYQTKYPFECNFFGSGRNVSAVFTFQTLDEDENVNDLFRQSELCVKNVGKLGGEYRLVSNKL